MNWFEKLVGFKETTYEATRQKLEVTGSQLCSSMTNRTYSVGNLELVSLQELRHRAGVQAPTGARLTFRNIVADVRALHQDDTLEGALFQVASQFNLLEMIGPDVSPEERVTRYQHDRTQGPACAIAAGAATIFRNYFVSVDGQVGQTSDKQLDGLADLGDTLARRLNLPRASLWTMRNGYALCSEVGLRSIGDHLRDASEADKDDLRSKLRIGLHLDVEVTEGSNDARPRLVSQAFCSALPVSYTKIDIELWRPFATLVLEAAYEATLLAAALNAGRGGSKIVLLTQLGGGVFGNDLKWIKAALKRALTVVGHHDLDVRLVSFGSIPTCLMPLEKALQ
jgi:hypothetical protein